MAVIKKYTKKDGSTAYKFNAYLGVNEKTGNKKRTTRQGFATRKEAKLALARLEAGVDKPKERTEIKQPTVVNPTTFKEVYEAWIKQYQNTVKKSTLSKTKLYFRVHILPKFGHLKLENITSEYCQEVVNEWSDNFAMYKGYASYSSRIFKFAKMKKWITENPFEYIVYPKFEKLEEDSELIFYTRSQLNDFLDFYKYTRPIKEYVLFRLLAYSGIRKGEALALNWSDIDFRHQTIKISKTVTKEDNMLYISTPKTKSSFRTLSLDKESLDQLRKWKMEQSRMVKIKAENEQLIFQSRDNGIIYLHYPNFLMAKYSGKIITVHGLRHTHASLLFEAGASIKEVQTRLGHSSIKTTMDIYAHVTKEAEQDVSNKFAIYMDSDEKGIKKGIKVL